MWGSCSSGCPAGSGASPRCCAPSFPRGPSSWRSRRGRAGPSAGSARARPIRSIPPRSSSAASGRVRRGCATRSGTGSATRASTSTSTCATRPASRFRPARVRSSSPSTTSRSCAIPRHARRTGSGSTNGDSRSRGAKPGRSSCRRSSRAVSCCARASIAAGCTASRSPSASPRSARRPTQLIAGRTISSGGSACAVRTCSPRERSSRARTTRPCSPRSNACGPAILTCHSSSRARSVGRRSRTRGCSNGPASSCSGLFPTRPSTRCTTTRQSS